MSRKLLVSLSAGDVRSESIGGTRRSPFVARLPPIAFACGSASVEGRDSCVSAAAEEVHEGRIRSAGFRKVLYVEPRDVYLRA